MLYFKCPSCKIILANKELIFEEELEKICKNDNIIDKKTAKMELLNKLYIPRPCCRGRTLGYIDLIKIIN